MNKDIEYPEAGLGLFGMKDTGSKLICHDFDSRQHEVTLDCLLTFRGYASSAHEFRESVLADPAACMNKYNERLVEIKHVKTGRVREGTPAESGKSVLRD